MTLSQTLRLLFTAATWGASHVLVRITVPEIGPMLTVFARMLIGALTLAILLAPKFKTLDLKGHWKFFLVIGILNTVVPLTLFSFASVYLPSAYLVIMNSTQSLFSAIFSSLILGEVFGLRKVFSLILGLTGVYFLTEHGAIEQPNLDVYLSLLACAAAVACYGLGGVVIRKYGKGADPAAIIGTSAWLGVFLLFPGALQAYQAHGPFLFSEHSFFSVALCLFILGAFGTGFAFVVFYKLITEIGPFKSSLTGFLMPAFGLLWGAIFLNEPLTLGTLAGAVLVLSSTGLFIFKK